MVCLQFLVKDYSGLASNMFTRVNLVDAGHFLGLKPKDVLANDSKLAQKLKQLERFNVWLECSLQRKNGQLFIDAEKTALKKYE